MKTINIIKRTLLTLVLVSGIACSNTNLVDQFAGSGSLEAIAIQIQAIQHLKGGVASELSAHGTKSFTNDLGYEIELAEAVLHFHVMRLISGGDDPSCFAGQDQEIELHRDRDLLGEDLLTHDLATTAIARTSYCQWELELGAADGHTNSPAFHVLGTWSKDGDTGDFMLMGQEIMTLGHAFKTKENDEVIVHPLHFEAGETLATVLIGTKYDELFDGVDFKGQSSAEQITIIYDNVKTAVHQHTGDPHGSAGDAGGHGDGGHHGS